MLSSLKLESVEISYIITDSHTIRCVRVKKQMQERDIDRKGKYFAGTAPVISISPEAEATVPSDFHGLASSSIDPSFRVRAFLDTYCNIITTCLNHTPKATHMHMANLTTSTKQIDRSLTSTRASCAAPTR